MSTINDTVATDMTNADLDADLEAALGGLTGDSEPEPTEAAPKAKRTRTSPRTKALDEVCVMLSAMVGDFEKGAAENEEENDDKIEVLRDAIGRVKTLADDGTPKAAYNGRHYLGVSEEGVRTHFQSNMPPTRRSFGPGSKANYTSVLGPFRTQEGVEFRIANPETPCPKVF